MKQLTILKRLYYRCLNTDQDLICKLDNHDEIFTVNENYRQLLIKRIKELQCNEN